MKTGESGINTHLAQDVTTLAEMIKIVRTDSVTYGFTSHDVDIVYDGVTYKATSAFDRTALEIENDLAPANFDIQGLIDSNTITEADIRAQKYHGAEVYFFVINWADTTDGIIKMQRGSIGDIELRDGIYFAELRGLFQRLNTNILNIFAPECNVDFGSTKCGVSLSLHETAGTVASLSDQRTFSATSLNTTEDFYNAGRLLWTGGLNNGIYQEVKESDAGANAVIKTMLTAPFSITLGDTFRIWAGCDKRFTTCLSLYSNTINYRGFPDIEGEDAQFEYPNASL